MKYAVPYSDLYAFVKMCGSEKRTVSQCVRSMMLDKKKRALQAIKDEWDISDEALDTVSKETERKVASLYRDTDQSSIYITFASAKKGVRLKNSSACKQIESLIRDIVQENGIKNVAIHVLLNVPHKYPIIYYYSGMSEYTSSLEFLLELPEGFEKQDIRFQRGNLEHELMHVACGHSVCVSLMSEHIAQRDCIDTGIINQSESFARLSRCYEYEADIYPTIKNKQTANSMLRALASVVTHDDFHPDIKKRKQLVANILRLGILEAQCAA